MTTTKWTKTKVKRLAITAEESRRCPESIKSSRITLIIKLRCNRRQKRQSGSAKLDRDDRSFAVLFAGVRHGCMRFACDERLD
jgi:hypothetical protein